MQQDRVVQHALDHQPEPLIASAQPELVGSSLNGLAA
jgi:hypothetical protein